METTSLFTVTVEGYNIALIRDGVVSAIGGFGAVDLETFEGEPADRELLRTLSERADEKVGQVLGT
jgi:hypothetical protein